jgi:hypothetical protein
MFWGFQASLADTNAHKLADLVAAAYSGVVPAPPNRSRQIDIQADGGNGGNVLIGDSSVSTTVYGKQLAAKAVDVRGPSVQDDISTLDIFLCASVATQKVNILLMAN